MTQIEQLKQMMHHYHSRDVEYWIYICPGPMHIVLDADGLFSYDEEGSEPLSVEAAIQYIKAVILEKL